MMVDIADVRDIRLEGLHHSSQSVSCVGGIDGMSPQFGPVRPIRLWVLEIDVGNKILVIGSGLAPWVGHGEQSHFMSLRAEQMHKLEEIDFSTAEGEIVFIAKEDFHKWRSQFLGECQKRECADL